MVPHQLHRLSRQLAPLLALLALLLASCAVQKKHAPQIPPAVTWELNTADQLQKLQTDYTSFFKDVGDAIRAGKLTMSQVSTLNAVGFKSKTAIEKANEAFKNWQIVRDEPTRVQVINLVAEASKIFLDLTAARVQLTAPGEKP